MRLHALTITAFGPFGGTEHVDFEALGEAGLFLLHGATGAGKTTVLDAVCFALYGAVPGARQHAGRLRSDHADPGVATRVELEVTIRGRRLLITRSPAWDRAKRRGEGVTRDPAKVHVRELVRGTEVSLSTRLDEAGQLLSGLVGMTCDQFCQVVLLPQGAFAEFLRADAESRRPLLERLFGTARFSAVEHHLAEQRRELGRAVDESTLEVDRLVARVAQAAGTSSLPTDCRGESARSWAAELLVVAHTTADAAAEAATGSAAGVQEALTAQSRAVEAASLHRRAMALAERACRLDDGAERRAADRRRVAAARRAAPLAPLLDERRRTAEAAGRARRRSDAALAAAARRHGAVTADDDAVQLRTLVQRTHGEIAVLEDLRDDVAEADRLERETRALVSSIASASAEAAAARRRLADAPQRRAELDRDVAAAGSAARAWHDSAERLRQLTDRLAAATERDRLIALVSGARALELDARSAVLEARSALLEARQQRLDGMAGELAAGLVSGEACPVCGGREHPRPAQQLRLSAPAEDEQRLERVVVAAEAAARERLETLTSVREQLAAASARAGAPTSRAGDPSDGLAGPVVGDQVGRLRADADLPPLDHAVAGPSVADLRRRVAAETARLARARSTAAGLAELTAALEQHDDDTRRVEAELARLEVDLAGRQALLEATRGRLQTLSARLAAAQGDDESIPARQVRLRRLADEAAAAAEALDQAGRADLAAAEASSVALAAAGAAGFAAVDEAGNALLAPAELDALEARLAEDEAERVAIAGQLAEPDVAAALGRPAPDVAAVRASLEAATARHEELTARRHDAVARVSALERLVVELDHRLGLLRPVRERYEVVDGLSRLVEGTGSDNALRMRLSAFVLAARLEQVADAATERLVRMSGGRYSLVHTDAVGAGRGRSGLGLRVCDAWTGVTRDPATLSGGESFVASLALALGLADVVTAEAGGATLDTLFIDEGFGTLDEDALEEVVDVLDGLREGGRVVGVVSHVAELRQRIPAQLRIRKAVTGSSVELVAVAPSSMAPRMAVGARSGAA